jgi:hypothetical protein
VPGSGTGTNVIILRYDFLRFFIQIAYNHVFGIKLPAKQLHIGLQNLKNIVWQTSTKKNRCVFYVCNSKFIAKAFFIYQFVNIDIIVPSKLDIHM